MYRTLPMRMHRKECEILVEAAVQYFEGTMGPGDCVTKLWNMNNNLKNQIIACRTIRDVVLTILNNQRLR